MCYLYNPTARYYFINTSFLSLQIQKMKLLLLAALVAVALAHPVEVSENDLNEWENFKVRSFMVYGLV